MNTLHGELPMKPRLLIRAVLLVLAGWLAWWCWGRAAGDPVLSLLYWLVVGLVGGLLFVRVILPWFADAVSTSIFLSGEKQPPETDDGETEQGDEAEKPAPEVNKDTKA